MGGETFLRLIDVGVFTEDCPDDPSASEASSLSDITRFAWVVRLMCDLAGRPKP